MTEYWCDNCGEFLGAPPHGAHTCDHYRVTEKEWRDRRTRDIRAMGHDQAAALGMFSGGKMMLPGVA